MIKHFEINLDSKYKFQLIDISSQINSIIKNQNLNEGILNIFSKHSTSGIIINENEEGLLKDFENSLKDLIPDNYQYLHDRIDNNAEAHIKSFLLSSSETVPVRDSKLDLGTWQSIFFLELDGPRHSRKISLTFIGE